MLENSSEIAGTHQSTRSFFFSLSLLAWMCAALVAAKALRVFLHRCSCPPKSGENLAKRYRSIGNSKHRFSDITVCWGLWFGLFTQMYFSQAMRQSQIPVST